MKWGIFISPSFRSTIVLIILYSFNLNNACSMHRFPINPINSVSNSRILLEFQNRMCIRYFQCILYDFHRIVVHLNEHKLKHELNKTSTSFRKCSIWHKFMQSKIKQIYFRCYQILLNFKLSFVSKLVRLKTVLDFEFSNELSQPNM